VHIFINQVVLPLSCCHIDLVSALEAVATNCVTKLSALTQLRLKVIKFVAVVIV